MSELAPATALNAQTFTEIFFYLQRNLSIAFAANIRKHVIHISHTYTIVFKCCICSGIISRIKKKDVALSENKDTCSSISPLFTIHTFFDGPGVRDFALIHRRCARITCIQNSVYEFNRLRLDRNQPPWIVIERRRRTSEISTIGHTLAGARVRAIRRCVAKSAIVSRYIHRSSRSYNSRFRWTIRLRCIPRAVPRDP